MATAPHNFSQFLKFIKNRIEKKWDAVIAIEGDEGAGKSTLGMLLGFKISKMLGSEFDLVRNISYLPTHEEMVDKFHSLPMKSVFDVDEAIKVMYKRNWQNRLQTKLVQMYATERWQGKVSILCIPRFNDFDEYFRNHRVLFRFWVVDRGVALVYMRDTDKDIPDPWHVKDSIKKKEKIFRNKQLIDVDLNMKIYAESKLKNFLFIFRFDDLPKDIKKKYEDLKEYYRKIVKEQEELVEESAKLMRWRTYAIRLEYFASMVGLSRIAIGKMLGLARNSISTHQSYLTDEDKSSVTEVYKDNYYIIIDKLRKKHPELFGISQKDRIGK